MRRSTIFVVGGVVLVVLLLCAALLAVLMANRAGIGTGWEPRWDRDRHHFDGPMWEPLEGIRVVPVVAGLLGLLGCLALAGVLVLAGVLLARSGRPAPPRAAEPPELAALRGRYARGEISREEYLARRDELSSR